MYGYFFEAWLDAVTLPLRLQTAAAASLMSGTVVVSTSLSFGTPRRRSSAKLTLVASNSWVRSHKSTANLTVVPR